MRGGRVCGGFGRVNLSYFICLGGSGRLNLSYFTCLRGSRGVKILTNHATRVGPLEKDLTRAGGGEESGEALGGSMIRKVRCAEALVALLARMALMAHIALVALMARMALVA